jgi:hypothetical protein
VWVRIGIQVHEYLSAGIVRRAEHAPRTAPLLSRPILERHIVDYALLLHIPGPVSLLANNFMVEVEVIYSTYLVKMWLLTFDRLCTPMRQALSLEDFDFVVRSLSHRRSRRLYFVAIYQCPD